MKKPKRFPDTDREWAILRGAIENTNEGFVTIDENHQVIIFNKAAEKIFGYSREEIIGKDLGLILSPECNQGHKQAVSRFLKTGESKLIGHQTEFLAHRKDGKKFPLSISFSLSNIEGKIYFTGIIRDLTETKDLQEQIAKSERLAAFGQLVAEIAHEIKNPLIMIGGFARQLFRTVQDEKSQAKLKIISDEVQRLEKLILELREVYQPQNLSFESFNINTLLEEIYSFSKEDCEKRNISLRLESEEDPLLVEGDPGKLKQVFLNLVKNAIEAMEKDGDLAIHSKMLGDQVEITIIDNGPGIREKDRDKLFTPFFTTKSRGTGLGLSVSKRIIEDHPGGSLGLDSEEGKGTVAKIVLPLFKPQKMKVTS